MQTLSPFPLRNLGLLASFCLPLSAFSQGSLTPPPGVPEPTMKTLAQIEPRTPINESSAPVTLSQPGSYYLTNNLTVAAGNAITIAASGVTLDLNGFTISKTSAASNAGIMINSALRDITITNGHIRGGVTKDGNGIHSGTGFADGITHSGTAPSNVLVSRVSVSGCLDSGITLGTGNSTLVEECSVTLTGGTGISASIVKASSAMQCESTAISASQAIDCRGDSTSGSGVSASVVHNCRGTSVDGSGVGATVAHNSFGTSVNSFGLSAVSAHNCYGTSDIGIGLNGNSLAVGCYGRSTSGSRGLYAQNAVFCTGARAGGTAIAAVMASGCYAASGTNSITYKYNMP